MNRLLAVMCITGGLATGSLILRSSALLIQRPITEDAFYVLSIARHVAAGAGFTIDGSSATNGFQPLYTFLVSGVAFVMGPDRLALIRAVYLLEWVIYLLTAAVLGRIASDLVEKEQRCLAFLATASIYLSLRLVLLQHLNGLETGLLLMTVALSWWKFEQSEIRGSATAVQLGALLGVAVLARLDVVFLVAGVVVLVWRTVGRAIRLRAACLTAVVPALFLAAWLLYSYHLGRTVMPTSGLAQQDWAFVGQRWTSMTFAVAQVGIPIYIGAFDNRLVAILRAVLVVVAAIAVVAAGRQIGATGEASRRSIRFGAALCAAYLMIAAWYASSSWAMHFYVRYCAPLMLVSCLAAGVAVTRLLQRHRAIGVAILCAMFVQSLIYVVALHAGVYAGAKLPGVAAWSRPLFLDQVHLVEAMVPSQDLVAAGQAGTLGYLRERVVNVDGKVNTEALRYQNAMTEYLDSKQIRWFCDMPSYVDRYLGPHPEQRGWSLVAEAGLFRLYRRT